MCPVCGIWDLKHFFPANDSSVPLVCWRLPTTKQSRQSADRPDLWLLFCSLLLSLWLQAICRTQTATLFPHQGSALKVLNPILHSGYISRKEPVGNVRKRAARRSVCLFRNIRFKQKYQAHSYSSLSRCLSFCIFLSLPFGFCRQKMADHKLTLSHVILHKKNVLDYVWVPW